MPSPLREEDDYNSLTNFRRLYTSNAQCIGSLFSYLLIRCFYTFLRYGLTDQQQFPKKLFILFRPYSVYGCHQRSFGFSHLSWLPKKLMIIF